MTTAEDGESESRIRWRSTLRRDLLELERRVRRTARAPPGRVYNIPPTEVWGAREAPRAEQTSPAAGLVQPRGATCCHFDTRARAARMSSGRCIQKTTVSPGTSIYRGASRAGRAPGARATARRANLVASWLQAGRHSSPLNAFSRCTCAHGERSANARSGALRAARLGRTVGSKRSVRTSVPAAKELELL